MAGLRSPRTRRRAVLSAMLGTAAVLANRDALAMTSTRFLPERFRPYWEDFRQRFVSSDGRVIDTGNGGRSHSEGQGWGMLFATEARDRTTFEAIHRFTLSQLRREDHLHRWLWLPDAEPRTPDANNATDGDVYIAWALLRAADIWDAPDHRMSALAIIRALETSLVRRHADLTFLLPGVDGFEHDSHWVLNLSYGVVPAWRIFARHGDRQLWHAISASHLRLLERARFGRFGLPPDWLRLERDTPEIRVSMAAEWPPRFSYDAVRVPLLLAWAGHANHPVGEAALALWRTSSPPPAWTDLSTDAVSPYPAAPGIVAIGDLLAAMVRRAATPVLEVPIPDTDDYYSSALRLLAVMAANHLEIGLRRT